MVADMDIGLDDFFKDMLACIEQQFEGSQKVFAAWVKIDPTAISHMLAGRRRPSDLMLRKLGWRRVVTYEKVWAPKAQKW